MGALRLRIEGFIVVLKLGGSTRLFFSPIAQDAPAFAAAAEAVKVITRNPVSNTADKGLVLFCVVMCVGVILFFVMICFFVLPALSLLSKIRCWQPEHMVKCISGRQPRFCDVRR